MPENWVNKNTEWNILVLRKGGRTEKAEIKRKKKDMEFNRSLERTDIERIRMEKHS